MLALDQFGDVARTCDRAAASEGLEARVFNNAVVADLELQLHHVTAFRRADDSRADARLVLGSLAISFAVGLVGMILFSRRDV